MKMLGHQHPSEQAEVLLLAKVGEDLNKLSAEAVRIKQAGAPVGAGGNEVQVVQSVVVPLARHGAILQLVTAHIAKGAMYAPPAD